MNLRLWRGFLPLWSILEVLSHYNRRHQSDVSKYYFEPFVYYVGAQYREWHLVELSIDIYIYLFGHQSSQWWGLNRCSISLSPMRCDKDNRLYGSRPSLLRDGQNAPDVGANSLCEIGGVLTKHSTYEGFAPGDKHWRCELQKKPFLATNDSTQAPFVFL